MSDDNTKVGKYEVSLWEASPVPAVVVPHVDEIAEEALQAAGREIVGRLKALGLEVTGDFMPDETFALEAVMQGFVRGFCCNIVGGAAAPPPAPTLEQEIAEAFPVGTRVRLKHDTDRYPFFVALEGAKGTVTDSGSGDGSSGYLHVKMDERLEGAEDWDNCVQWLDDMDPRDDLDVIEERFLEVRYEVTGLSADEVGSLEGEAWAQAEASDSEGEPGDDLYRSGHPDVPVAARLVDRHGEEVLDMAPSTDGAFVVETVHEGSAWGVRRATAAEIADPDEETLPLEEALDWARRLAAKLDMGWFDMSGDPALSYHEEAEAVLGPRTVLVHLNVEVPADARLEGLTGSAPITSEVLEREIKGVLEVGTDPEQTPALAVSTVVVALAEEI